MALKITQSEQEGNVIIRPEGEVDLYSSPELRKAILGAASKNAHSLALDLGAVTYMDSSGVATLVEGLQNSGKGQKSFVLLAPSQAVIESASTFAARQRV